MEQLIHRIDELIEGERLDWHRKKKRLFISLSKNGRSQTVQLALRRNQYVFSSVVARICDLNKKEDRKSLAYRLWRRNALKPVVTFDIDDRERVIGWIALPIERTHSKDLKFYIESLARECDRFEYILTGTDRH